MTDSVGRILAVGAAGRFAGLVVPELARRGTTVRGLVQAADHRDAARRNGAAEVAVGDLRDIDTLRPALEGCDRVFYIAPVFSKDESRLGLNLVEAAKSAGVRRIVFSSAIHPVLSALENHAAKAPVEEAIITSDLQYSILHPCLFFQNYAAAWPKVAALMARALGREVRAETAPFDAWADAAGLPKDGGVRPGLKAMYAWYDAHGFLGNALILRAILGREARSLGAYFSELASDVD